MTRLGWSLGWVACLLATPSWGGQSLPPVHPAVFQTVLRVQAQAGVADMQCRKAPGKPRVMPAPDVDPPEAPSDEDVQNQLQDFQAVLTPPQAEPSVRSGDQALWPVPLPPVLRLGIWGDSHLAAGFWSQELQRLSQLPAEAVHSRFVPASMNRPGVRLPLRKTCMGPHWQYESAHASASAAAMPGPGLVSLSARQNDAWLSWDLRDATGQADKQQLRLQYQQSGAPIQLAIRIDAGDEQRVTLQGPEGPAVLDLVAAAPLSTVHLRVVRGPWRMHGLEWPMPETTRLQLDVFGFPGATVAGWRQAKAQALAPWWGTLSYDVVVLAYGTNEGNVQPFDDQTYARQLQEAVSTLRQTFPQAACLLVAPGDRGVLVRRSQKKRPAATASKVAKPGRNPDLLRYTRVHAAIGRIQKQVAQDQGCHFWSLFQAMGEAGSAYRWLRHNPPWMAKDLIHFSVAGYQRWGQLMAQDLAWGPALFAPADSASKAP